MNSFRVVLLIAFATLLVSGCVRGRYSPPKSHQVQSTAEVALPSEQLFDRALKYLASKGYPVRSVQREQGLITVNGQLPSFDGLDCGSVRGNAQMLPVSFEISITVIKLSPESASISVAVTGDSSARHARKFLFIPTGRKTDEVGCVSTGKVEREILAVASM